MMKSIFIALLLTSTWTAQAAPVLEPVKEIPNTYNTLDWNKYSTKDIRTATAYAERMRAEEKQAKIDSVCKGLESKAFSLCKQAQTIELTETSAVKPVQAWLVAALSVDGQDQEQLLKIASEVAASRMTEDTFVNLASKVYMNIYSK